MAKQPKRSACIPEVWASELDRVSICPASWRLARSIAPPLATPQMLRGLRIHQALAGESPADLSPEERQQVKDAWDTAYWAVCSILNKQYSDLYILREWPTTLSFKKGNLIGRFDLVVHDPETKRACVVDWKTTAWYQWDIASNLQLAAGALAAHELLDVGTVYVTIVETARGTYVPEWHIYTAEQLFNVRRRIDQIITAAVDKNAKTRRGYHCRHCPAVSICPETLRLPEYIEKKPPKAIKQYVQGLSADKLSDLLNAWHDWVKATGRALEEEAKRRLSEGEDVPGWTLAAGQTVREIRDVTQLWFRLKDLGISGEEFLNKINISIKAVEELLKTKYKSTREVKAAVNKVLDGLVVEKQRAPRLKRNNENNGEDTGDA